MILNCTRDRLFRALGATVQVRDNRGRRRLGGEQEPGGPPGRRVRVCTPTVVAVGIVLVCGRQIGVYVFRKCTYVFVFCGPCGTVCPTHAVRRRCYLQGFRCQAVASTLYRVRPMCSFEPTDGVLVPVFGAEGPHDVFVALQECRTIVVKSAASRPQQ